MQSVCKHGTLGKKWREGRRQTPQSCIPSLLQGKRKGVEGARNRRDGRKRKEIRAFEQSAEGLFSAERRGKNSPLGGQQVAALQLLRGCWEVVVSMVSGHLSAGTVWLSTLLRGGFVFSTVFHSDAHHRFPQCRSPPQHCFFSVPMCPVISKRRCPHL